jgi:hypothetical protein
MNQEPAISDDAIQTGIEDVVGRSNVELNIIITPFSDPQGKVWFRIEGNHEQALQAIYENKPIGALDALKAIKALRQAIFALKGHGNGRRYGYSNQK